MTVAPNPVRRGLLGASRIAAREFLPALAQEGGGRAEVVGAREASRARAFAQRHGVARAVGGYRAVVEDPDIDAVYVALPNDLHTRWAAAAARAGKAVLCEKPLGLDEADVARLVASTGAGALIWEAMLFPFHPLSDLLQGLIAAELGGITGIESDVSFVLDDAADFRWDPTRGGGALYDIGCYCIRLSRLLFASEPERADACAVLCRTGVDVSTDARLHFPRGATCRFSCSFSRPSRFDATVTGPGGSITATDPYHPGASGALVLRLGDGPVRTWRSPPESVFFHGLRHIHRVLRGEAAPRYLVDPESIRQAHAVDMVRVAARLGGHPAGPEGPGDADGSGDGGRASR